ncbi:MAG: hypothetical protein UZ07_CHB004002360 [Chlorobi bacterium OLB7]|nr:MAG: hypothetical protein UZ07_CHB004002360 [Chlorobi bacterium OLB7]
MVRLTLIQGCFMERISTIASPAWDWLSLDAASKVMEDQNAVADRIIDAYKAGVNTGRIKERQEVSVLIKKTLKENSALAAAITREVLACLDGKKIVHEQPLLNIASLSEFRILIPVREDDFVRDDFDAVYGVVWEAIARYEQEWFQPSVNFLPVATPEHINHQALYSDGYTLRFG